MWGSFRSKTRGAGGGLCFSSHAILCSQSPYSSSSFLYSFEKSNAFSGFFFFFFVRFFGVAFFGSSGAGAEAAEGRGIGLGCVVPPMPRSNSLPGASSTISESRRSIRFVASSMGTGTLVMDCAGCCGSGQVPIELSEVEGRTPYSVVAGAAAVSACCFFFFFFFVVPQSSSSSSSSAQTIWSSQGSCSMPSKALSEGKLSRSSSSSGSASDASQASSSLASPISMSPSSPLSHCTTLAHSPAMPVGSWGAM
mmetsp:Transcript_19805/g.75928  ORF Transcript_19805/g.75928 Transcript_19805/m.75928 type:complete len:252 (+) Transcript_19805:519-1274(+)